MLKISSLALKAAAVLSCSLSLSVAAHASAQVFEPVNDFGANPGALTASIYTPATNPGSALVVLLHGCVQDGIELADNSGLTGLAQEKQFAVLVPQQSFDNNVKRCFNWFSAQDTQADSGEMLSLKNMITQAQVSTGTKRVYLVGLSAGGAMASAALVNNPDLFSAGAVIAGLPYPCADNLTKAISCMKKGPAESTEELVSFVRKLHPEQAHWPTLSIWTGTTDAVVHPQNAQSLAAQWVQLSGVETAPRVEQFTDYRISRWTDTNGQELVSLIEIHNMGHGIAVDPTIAHGGKEGDFLLKAPISTVGEIIRSWGL